MQTNLAPFDLLPSTEWTTDSGFKRYINKHYNNMGDYYFQNQSHRTLFELVGYMDSEGLNCIIEYFEFPPDLQKFVLWTGSNIALGADLSEIEVDYHYQLFRFSELYAIYKTTAGMKHKWLVWKNKITDANGVDVSGDLIKPFQAK